MCTTTVMHMYMYMHMYVYVSSVVFVTALPSDRDTYG